MLEQYKKELEKLLEQSEDKGPNWEGWFQIERLEDIIAKYTLFKKIS